MAVLQGSRVHGDGAMDQLGFYVSFSNDGLYWAYPTLMKSIVGDENYPTAINDSNGDSREVGQTFKLVYSKGADQHIKRLHCHE